MHEFWKDEPVIASELEEVNSLINLVISRSHPFVRKHLVAGIQPGGKMLRPALVLIGARLGDASKLSTAKNIGSVIEMIHVASLIHDDIIDSASMRRGIPTLHSQVGIKQAVLAGDYLLSKAMSLVERQEGDLKPATVAHAFSRLCQSELEQDATQGDFSIPISVYLRRIAGKTATLFALSAYAGAAVTSAPKPLQYSMHRIGYLLGMAFQIQDDILDYQGKTYQLGKNSKTDLLNGIPTLPLIEALEIENSIEKEGALSQLLKKKRLKKRDLVKASQLVVELGGVEKSEELAVQYIERAKQNIATLQHSEVERLLSNMLYKLLDRKM